jgi:hypothetical protein
MEQSKMWAAGQMEAYTEVALMTCAQPRRDHYLMRNLSRNASLFLEQLPANTNGACEAFIGQLLSHKIVSREADKFAVGEYGDLLIDHYISRELEY